MHSLLSLGIFACEKDAHDKKCTLCMYMQLCCLSSIAGKQEQTSWSCIQIASDKFYGPKATVWMFEKLP